VHTGTLRGDVKGESLDHLDAREGKKNRWRRQNLPTPAPSAEHDPVTLHDSGIDPNRN
jgi:hypothetical protein